MSSLAGLVAGRCSEGVPLKPLGEVGTFVRGNGMQKKDLVDSGTPAIHYGQIFTYYGTAAYETKSYVEGLLAERAKKADPGDLVIATTSENDEDVARAVAWLGDEAAAVSGDAYIYRHTLDPKFVAYFFQSRQFQDQKARHVTGTKVRRISGTALAQIRIPVPPLNVQRDVVRLLDLFVGLKTKLQDELLGRRRQRVDYQHKMPLTARFRELSPDGPERVVIKAVAKQYVEPVRVQPDETYVNLGVRWYGEGAFARPPKVGKDIKGTTLYRVKPGQFVYNRMFVTEGSFGLITPDLAHGVVSNEFPVYDLDETRVLPEWLYTRFQDAGLVAAAAAETTGGTKSRRRWKEEQFEAFEIELPSLAAQYELVRVISTFNQLEGALGAELAARQKQYEHYLTRLMAFAEAAA